MPTEIKPQLQAPSRLVRHDMLPVESGVPTARFFVKANTVRSEQDSKRYKKALAILKDQAPWACELIVVQDDMKKVSRKRIFDALSRLDVARLEVARQRVVKIERYRDWAAPVLPEDLREAMENPINIALIDGTHVQKVRKAFWTMHQWEMEFINSPEQPADAVDQPASELVSASS